MVLGPFHGKSFKKNAKILFAEGPTWIHETHLREDVFGSSKIEAKTGRYGLRISFQTFAQVRIKVVPKGLRSCKQPSLSYRAGISPPIFHWSVKCMSGREGEFEKASREEKRQRNGNFFDVQCFGCLSRVSFQNLYGAQRSNTVMLPIHHFIAGERMEPFLQERRV